MRILRRVDPPFQRSYRKLKNIPTSLAGDFSRCVVSPLTVGTTSAIRAVVDGSPDAIPAGLWCYRVDRQRSLVGGALNEGGNIFAWIIKTLQLGDRSSLENVLAAAEPDGHGLTVLPFLAGERAPGWAGHARGTLQGLSFATTPVDILRAGLEAVAYRVAIVFERLCQLLPSKPQVVASGGALLGSPAWIQIMADVLAHSISISEVQEASSRGAVLLALESMGILRNLREAPHFIGRIYEPDMNRHSRYREAMQRQMVLYDKLVRHHALKGVAHR